jgi:hypothetical protein
VLKILLNTAISAVVIGVAAWLANTYPRIAGFVVALPLATLLVLPMAHAQSSDPARLQQFAVSILIALPVVMFFLVPFVLALRYGLSFWASYALGCAWLLPGFFLHRWLVKFVG